MLNFGFHVSIAGGIEKSFDNAMQIGDIQTFQIFTRNSRSWASKPLNKENIELFKIRRHQLAPKFKDLVVHMPYLSNLAAPDSEISEKSKHMLIEEIKRCDLLDINYLVTHIGSHKGAGHVVGVNNIVTILESVIGLEPKVNIILENTAGTKNSVGSTFEDINHIIESLSDPSKVNVCLDTCHAFAAGYNLKSELDVEKTMEAFDRIIGSTKLRVLHCNDSKGTLSSNKDRHEHIGRGNIGFYGFRALFRYKCIQNIPIILETPKQTENDDKINLLMVRTLEKGEIPSSRSPSKQLETFLK